MDTTGVGHPDPSLDEVILREATEADAAALELFDLGSGVPWLDEVAEIVHGLLASRDDPSQADFDRQVLVAEIEGELVAVAAHERVEHERLGVLIEHRYLMVVAVRTDHQGIGLARAITEAAFAEMQADGIRSVRWLVHPRNDASVAFSRGVFPEADEASPPEDRPYFSYVLGL